MGEIHLIPLDRIRDNPYQVRHDYSNIAELAQKIRDMKGALPATIGLIHPPTARLTDEAVMADGNWHVELAEGHRRLRAFYLLRDGAPDLGLEPDADYDEMPINLVELEDQAMDDIAWDENTARKDLSPVEQAQSLQHTIETFHITQSELADRRRLGRSTVANKLRLLALPNDLLQAIHDGRLTERHGMSYLPLVDVPAADLELVQKNLATNIDFMFGSYWPPHPDTLRKRLLEVGDLTADQVRAIVDRMKMRIEEARRRKWNDNASDGMITNPGGSEATNAAVKELVPDPKAGSMIRYYNRETGEIQDAPPAGDLNVYYGESAGSPSTVWPGDSSAKSVDLYPPVTLLVWMYVRRSVDGGMKDFRLMVSDVNGAAVTIDPNALLPNVYRGPFDQLHQILDAALSEFAEP